MSWQQTYFLIGAVHDLINIEKHSRCDGLPLATTDFTTARWVVIFLDLLSVCFLGNFVTPSLPLYYSLPVYAVCCSFKSDMSSLSESEGCISASTSLWIFIWSKSLSDTRSTCKNYESKSSCSSKIACNISDSVYCFNTMISWLFFYVQYINNHPNKYLFNHGPYKVGCVIQSALGGRVKCFAAGAWLNDSHRSER